MSYINKRWIVWLRVGMLATVCFGMALSADAANLTVPNSFTAGNTISANSVNQNFSTITTNLPAVKQSGRSLWIQVPAAAAALQSVTVTPPGNGFALVMASGSVEPSHTAGNSNFFCLQLDTLSGVSGVSGCSPSGPDAAYRAWVTSLPTMSSSFELSYNLMQVFPVTAGTPITFYLNGYATVTGTDTDWMFQPILTVLFVPNTM